MVILSTGQEIGSCRVLLIQPEVGHQEDMQYAKT